MAFSENQVGALHGAMAHKLMVITGGPGTGKTTIVNAILKIFGRRRPGCCWPRPRAGRPSG